MKSSLLFLLIILTLNSTNVICQANPDKNTTNCHSIHYPSPYAWAAFDTNNCKNYIDTLNRIQSLVKIDTNTDKRYLQQFDEPDFHLYYQHDTNEFIMQYNVGHAYIFTAFWNNGLINIMRHADSCKVTEIDYDKNGKVSEQFYCDYSRPNSGYKKEYSNGKIIDEVFYTPISFYTSVDSTSLDSFSIMNDVVAMRMIQFNEEGKITRDIDLDKLFKSLQKKQ